jgi:S-phase kinase-associated protein 1
MSLQEEKLEPLKNATDDPRIRLLNRLYAKKRKELQEKEKQKVQYYFVKRDIKFATLPELLFFCRV